jgi:hypothetical protein
MRIATENNFCRSHVPMDEMDVYRNKVKVDKKIKGEDKNQPDTNLGKQYQSFGLSNECCRLENERKHRLRSFS